MSDPTSTDSCLTPSRRTFLRSGAAAAGAFSLAGCLTGGGSGNDSVVVGANLPLSGGQDSYGKTMHRAAQVAATHINDNGGLDGKDVEVVVEDNQTDPKTVIDKTNKLIQKDGADVLFGPVSSASRNAMDSILKSEKVPLLYPIQYEGTVANDYCNEYIYKFGETPRQQINPFVPWLAENYGDSFFLLGSDYVWPKRINSIVKDKLESNGGTVVGEQYVSIGTTDFSSIISKIESENPDVLFMDLVGQSAVAIQKQMHNRGVRDQFQDVGLGHGQGLLAGISPGASKGLLTCHEYMENLDNSANERFVGDFHNEYGQDALINYMTGPSYTALQFLKAAADEAGSAKVDDILGSIGSGSVDAPVGSVSVANDQQIKTGCTVGKVNDNQKYDPVTSFDPVTVPDQCSSI